MIKTLDEKFSNRYKMGSTIAQRLVRPGHRLFRTATPRHHRWEMRDEPVYTTLWSVLRGDDGDARRR